MNVTTTSYCYVWQWTSMVAISPSSYNAKLANVAIPYCNATYCIHWQRTRFGCNMYLSQPNWVYCNVFSSLGKGQNLVDQGLVDQRLRAHMDLLASNMSEVLLAPEASVIQLTSLRWESNKPTQEVMEAFDINEYGNNLYFYIWQQRPQQELMYMIAKTAWATVTPQNFYFGMWLEKTK